MGVRGCWELRDAVVSAVRANPPPKQTLRVILGERAVVQAHADRPKPADLLESDGRVSWVGLEELEVLVGEFTDGVWQLAVVEPEL